MRKFTFIFFLSIGALFLQGQNITELSYLFNYNLAESNGNGPNLNMLDSAGMFVIDTLTGLNNITKVVYRFKRNSGVQFNNALAGNFLDSTYSIEMYFVFDDVTGYKRVIDWKNRTTDLGAYILSGLLDFYPYATSDSAMVVAGEYTYYVLTRNGLTKELKIYSNANLGIDFTDASNDAVIDTSHVLNFFQDDLIAQNEASPGAVALLDLYNYVLDSATIRHKFDSLQGELTAIRAIGSKDIRVHIYPNPASDKVNIDLRQFNQNGQVNVSVITSTGIVVYNRVYFGGSNYRIDLNSLALPNGIYLVKAESSNEIYSQKFVIRR
jgi:hypothetical protein